MPETTIKGKWLWYNVMRDLEEQGGLKGVVIDILSVTKHGCGGVTMAGTKFYITWVLEVFLLVSMTKEEAELIDAFAKILGHRPFCRYIDDKSKLLTYEWCKIDAKGRYAELKKEGKKIQLQRVR